MRKLVYRIGHHYLVSCFLVQLWIVWRLSVFHFFPSLRWSIHIYHPIYITLELGNVTKQTKTQIIFFTSNSQGPWNFSLKKFVFLLKSLTLSSIPPEMASKRCLEYVLKKGIRGGGGGGWSNSVRNFSGGLPEKVSASSSQRLIDLEYQSSAHKYQSFLSSLFIIFFCVCVCVCLLIFL